MFHNIHWTVNAHSVTSVVFPIGWIIYNSAHDSQTYRKWLLKKSPLEMSDDLAQRLETQLQNVSDRRLRPYREARFSTCIIDELESDTLGSMVHIRAGSLFKLSSRLEINETDTIRKYFPNLASMERKLSKFKVDTASISDDVLKKAILSEDAKNFALTREILRADSGVETLVPFLSALVFYFGTLPVLHLLRPIVGSVMSLAFSLGISTVVFVGFFKSFQRFCVLRFDEKAFSIDDSYKTGCEQYLKASIELGKIMHDHGAEELRKLVKQTGDCLFHVQNYSERLAKLEGYVKKNELLQKK